jgi:hypothetical protein
MEKPALLTDQQVEVLDNLVREKRDWLLGHGIDVRLWGPADDGSHYRIIYRGDEAISDPLVEPFMLYGPGSVAFVSGEVSSL